ncbi:MAG: hypothetical protein L6Q83_02945, partial [Gammaproteobacteria bacterium]|nr:hypothetical protein [Gammaproteobacteria bacterium]
ANAITVNLVAHNQRSSSGTLSTLKWATCAPTGATNPCLSTNSGTTGGAWSLANATGSTATWDWNPATGVLTSSGLFQTTSFVSSNANGSPVISDKVVDMVIDTTNDTTTATSYNCVEGTFLAGVGAHGCANVSLGDDTVYDSAVVYNVGGGANCVQRTLGGDDVSTGNPRSLASTAGGGGCDPGDGAFNLWTVVSYTGPGGELIVSNGIDIATAGTNYLTFQVVPLPAAAWLLAPAVLAAARFSRRRKAA